MILSFAAKVGAQHTETPPTHAEPVEGDNHASHEHGEHSRPFEGLAFFRAHSEEGFAGEILLEIHPHVSPVGVGILLGGYGQPNVRGGFFDFDARLVFHLHRPNPLDVRILLGVDQCVVPAFRTFANATVHFTLSWHIAPVVAPSLSYFPETWGQGNHGEWRLDLPVGIRVHLPYRNSGTYLSATVNFIFEDLRTTSPPNLGTMFVIEQQLF